MSSRKKPRGNDPVAGIPVAGFVGVNGAGKTLLAVQSALHDLARGREVYSTLPVSSPWGDTKPIRSLRQLLHIRDSTLLLDEVAVIFSSRRSASLPSELETLLQTLRHSRNTVRWTAPTWMRCEILLRESTQGVLNVVPIRGGRTAANPWPQPRLIMTALLDTSAGKVDEMPTERIGWPKVSRPRKLDACGTYDTHADTPLIGRRLESGRCVDCGGSRRVPEHSKARHEALGLPWYDDDLLSRVASSPAGTDRHNEGAPVALDEGS